MISELLKIMYRSLVICRNSRQLLFFPQMYRFLLHVQYRYCFSCCNAMEPIKSDFYSLQLSLFGSYSSVESVYIISFTGTPVLFVLSRQHTCTDSWRILIKIPGDPWEVYFFAQQVGAPRSFTRSTPSLSSSSAYAILSTGSEAMFADEGHFSKRSIEVIHFPWFFFFWI